MFGYVRPSIDHLTEEEKKRFSAVYCGLCRTLGERYGLSARFILNYDFAFLVLLLSESDAPQEMHRACLAHPIKGRAYFEMTAALELAADCSVILTWWQLRDGVSDHGVIGGAKYRVGASLLSAAYQKAKRLRPRFDECTRVHLDKLSALERAGCASIDEAADTFAELLRGIADEVDDPVKARILEQMLYHLGRWIYLIDAADDLADDYKCRSYNPLIGRFSLSDGVLTEQARDDLVTTLDHSIRLIAAAFELWNFGDWSGIIRSVVYEGLFCVGKAVLEGTFHADGRRACGRDEDNL